MTATARHIDPTEQQVKTLAEAAKASDEPVMMVNLLAFNDAGGRESYLRYAAEVQPHLDRVGATIVCVADAAQVVIGEGAKPWWDTILIVRYPSRAKFLEMVLDPGYQAISVHRTEALETSGLIATNPWPAEI
ncbi:DUF1330 domain-containing protein [Nocardia lijiangensis]|uniref:DUF1330 domain-containing protein n=1 Tax=Nocardia lijiangensis TaxID=299618 RepID=UPI00082C4613|nr:DUF1330 domain-containing protein [Nocardia lijiangensis]